MKFHGGSWLERAGLWLAHKVPALRPPLTRRVINHYAGAAPPRPHPYSLAVDGYTSWTSLSDRSYSGRHLPPCSREYEATLPREEDVVGLFMRDKPAPARDTSLLFPFFAQWFTDSFLRTHPCNPRRNQSNHGIDLCQIYGMGEVQTRALRDSSGGRLKSQFIKGGEFGVPLFANDDSGRPVLREEFAELYTPENFDRVLIKKMNDQQRRLALAVGLEHGNSTLGNSLMNTLFLREHNRLADLLQQAHPRWDNDRVFETARSVNIVILLKIVVEDYIRHIARPDVPLKVIPGFGEKEQWYRTNWMAVEFNLLYRWHGLIPDTFTLAGKTYPSPLMVNANHLLLAVGVDEVARSASNQRAGRIGLGHTPAFLKPVKQITLSLAREAKLQPYNEYRKHFGLDPVRSFDELTDDAELAEVLKKHYKSVDDVEFLVGLLAEKYGEHDMMGDLQLTMVAHDAFTHALTNPLLASSVFGEKTFSAEGLEQIEQTSGIADLIVRNTGLSPGDASFEYEG